MNKYASGSKSTGITAKQVFKELNKSIKKGSFKMEPFQPDYILDTPDRRLSKRYNELLEEVTE